MDYSNEQVTQNGGTKKVRHVKITGKKGYKKVITYRNGRKVGSSKKPLKPTEITMIRVGKFIPGLFSDCKCGEKKTRKNRKSRRKSKK